ncbi:ABC transporter permease [Opitutus sp. ER46]|uniref:ABC transporter permease n=1 Tax=Opitutus sp. ER46 TaxID=2161864 RepID=UPI000D2FAB79|nr:ABC transporter permease [Opitutus sp. ER46]PTX92610.1 sugar ABC transporter permease [Opitutus sp. ER46]
MASFDSSSVFALLNPWCIGRNLWRHRELAWQFAVREIEVRHRGSRLGAIWALVNPLSMLVLYWFVFGAIFGGRFNVLPGETEFDFVLALFFGLAMYHVFAETLGWGPLLIAGNPNFVKKVVFPLEVLPVAKVGDAAYHLGVSLALVLVGSLFGTAGVSWSVLWLPVLILPLLMLALGIGWALSAIGVFIRDVAQLTPFIGTALQFGSAVMFAPTKMTALPYAWEILRFNPLLQILDLGRRVVLWHQPMPWTNLAYVYAVALVTLALGHACFMLLRRSFAEVI